MGSWSRNLGYLCFNNHSGNSRRNSAPPPLGRAARAWLLTRELSYVRVNEANTRERAKQSISVAWRHSKQFRYYFLRWSMDNRKTVFLLSMVGLFMSFLPSCLIIIILGVNWPCGFFHPLQIWKVQSFGRFQLQEDVCCYIWPNISHIK